MSTKSTSYRSVRKSKFTQISNQLLNDEELTLESKALLSIFLSNSDNWELHMSEIIKRSKNGRDAHYSALKKLIIAGYIARLEFKQNINNQFVKLEYIFSDSKEDIWQGIEEAKVIAKENNQSIVLTYKNISCEKIDTNNDLNPYPEFQYTEESNPKIPFTENPDAANTNTEIANTENQYINNTNINNTNINNTNINNGMNGVSAIKNSYQKSQQSIHSIQNDNNYLIDEQKHLLKLLPQDLQEFVKTRYTLEDSINIINKIIQAKRAAGDRRNDNLFFYFEHNNDLSEAIIEILISVNREMKKKRESVESMLGYYYNALVNGLEEFHFTMEARKNMK
ncbi:nuclease [Mammaliicoccus sciuri]|uniref:nuclease n=1 Tax=Mammaliicoccus sciuri TaxID=1296 RepID=UPI002DBAF418|nr:nuclease [Mammaliicoccus sciuri]MEB7784188.1 nuclease [Mammaliicoccus sciuri]